MKPASIEWSRLQLDPELVRTGHSKAFLGRLRASIDAIGLAEPLKVSIVPDSQTAVVVDGVMRYQAMEALRADDPARFAVVPVFEIPFKQRFEVRYQTDVYQDLLPSQLAALVEHLHQREGVTKAEIAQAIGVSSATLRNYTGLWRMLQRGGLFAAAVELMDHGVLPASNPYAWLRLNAIGMRAALEALAEGRTIETWLAAQRDHEAGVMQRRISLDEVERVTGALPETCYREKSSIRQMKKDLGLRRQRAGAELQMREVAGEHLSAVIARSDSSLLVAAAVALRASLK